MTACLEALKKAREEQSGVWGGSDVTEARERHFTALAGIENVVQGRTFGLHLGLSSLPHPVKFPG